MFEYETAGKKPTEEGIYKYNNGICGWYLD